MSDIQQPPADYIQITLTAPRRWEEELTMLLFDQGAEGVEVQDNALITQHLQAGDWDASIFDGQELPTEQVRLRTLLPLNAAGRAAAQQLRDQAQQRPGVSCELEILPPVDWQEQWKRGFSGRPLAERLWLRPYWDENPPPAGRVAVTISPGMAFGTGDHATTAMMLELIETYLQPGGRVIDFGCGSGILGVAALHLGADSAVGVDIDPVCEAAVAEHLRLNQIDPARFEFHLGDILASEKLQRSLRRNKGQLVLANINAAVLRDLAGIVGRFMAPGGYFLCSGILIDYAAEVAQAIVNAGLSLVGSRRQGDWAAYVAVASYE